MKRGEIISLLKSEKPKKSERCLTIWEKEINGKRYRLIQKYVQGEKGLTSLPEILQEYRNGGWRRVV